jgi:hypothetical protein
MPIHSSERPIPMRATLPAPSQAPAMVARPPTQPEMVAICSKLKSRSTQKGFTMGAMALSPRR